MPIQERNVVRLVQLIPGANEGGDRASTLMHALTPEQQKAATLPFTLEDLVLPPGIDGKRIEREGLKASGMTPTQRDKLLSLTAAWVNILSVDAAAEKMAQIKSDLANTYFAWSGRTTTGDFV